MQILLRPIHAKHKPIDAATTAGKAASANGPPRMAAEKPRRIQPCGANRLIVSNSGGRSANQVVIVPPAIPVRITDEMMPGVVAVPHGWGHKNADGLSVASRYPGVNINYLTPDGPDGCEKLAGMSHMTGVVIDIRKAG